jgi:Spy/CpxP family protein refolding chaperone
MLLVLQSQQGGRGGDGGGALPPPPAFHEPTPFERFVDKLNLDSKQQLPDVAKIFTATIAETTPVGREMVQLRLRMIEVDGKPDEAAPVLAAYTTAATKLTGIEARTYQQVYALLKKDQQTKSAEAFLLMEGLLDVPLPRAAQGDRRGGGGGGAASLSRMELLTSLFGLEGGQKKQVKSIMDAESKAAASLRDQWTATRAAIGTAIQAGKGPFDIDQAVSRHAADATLMASAEMKALVKIMAVLTAEQKAKVVAIQASAFFMRGAFTGKKWDTTPS